MAISEAKLCRSRVVKYLDMFWHCRTKHVFKTKLAIDISQEFRHCNFAKNLCLRFSRKRKTFISVRIELAGGLDYLHLKEYLSPCRSLS